MRDEQVSVRRSSAVGQRFWTIGLVLIALLTACAPRSIQPDGVKKAEHLSAKALELFEAGRFDEAIPLAQEALTIRKTVLGPRHPDTATTLDNLAQLYKKTGVYTRAHPLLEEALAIRREVLGTYHRTTVSSLNNLALLLDEALQQMQQQPKSGKPGSGSCKKPGGNGSSSGQSKKMAKTKANQEALSKQLEEMKKALEKGKKPGDKPGQRPGEKNAGGMGVPGMSEQLAKLAAQQAAIRKEMQRAAQELNKDGTGAGNGLEKLAEQMEQNEKDIVNRNITQETLKRQQDIMVRLLEAEKSERERELDNKRESNEGKETPHPDPVRFFEYQRTKQREAELLRTVPPGLKPYYKEKVNEYFDTFDRP